MRDTDQTAHPPSVSEMAAPVASALAAAMVVVVRGVTRVRPFTPCATTTPLMCAVYCCVSALHSDSACSRHDISPLWRVTHNLFVNLGTTRYVPDMMFLNNKKR